MMRIVTQAAAAFLASAAFTQTTDAPAGKPNITLIFADYNTTAEDRSGSQQEELISHIHIT
jgi:hypothetical protein